MKKLYRVGSFLEQLQEQIVEDLFLTPNRYKDAFNQLYSILNDIKKEEDETYKRAITSSSINEYSRVDKMFNKLYEDLKNTTTEQQTRELIHKLKEKQNEIGEINFFKRYNFKFMEKKGFLLVVLKSVFEPEDWTDNFYNGLKKIDNLDDQMACELGCGCGLLSIWVAKNKNPEKVFGIDINPHAILNSKINAKLNNITNVQFMVSDLLNLNLFSQFSLIFACIPQIIRKNIGKSGLTLESLESRSHFCEPQMNDWDESGLGLNAQALMDASKLITQRGKVILNLAGRLGPEYLDSMAYKLGYESKVLYRSIFQQATTGVQGTVPDLSSFIEFEMNNPSYTCEFFTSEDGNKESRISAQQSQDLIFQNWKRNQKANAYLGNALKFYNDEKFRNFVDEAKLIAKKEKKIEEILKIKKFVDTNFPKDELHEKSKEKLEECLKKSLASTEKEIPIYHYVTVYEMTLRNRGLHNDIYDFLKKPPVFMFTEKEIIPFNFFEKMLKFVENLSFIDYGHIRGSEKLRKGFCEFLRKNSEISFSVDNLFVSTSFRTLILNLFTVYKPQKAIYYNLKKDDLDLYDDISVVKPKSFEELTKLIKDDLLIDSVVIELNDNETIDKYFDLINARKVRFYIRVNKVSEFGKMIIENNRGIPTNCTLLYDLKVDYYDVQLCVVISQNMNLLKNIALIAELTYSRIPFASEYFFEHYFEEYLSLDGNQSNNDYSFYPKREKGDSPILPQIEVSTQKVLESDTMEDKRIVLENTVESDSGINLMEMPHILKQLLFESFMHQSQLIKVGEQHLFDVIQNYLLAKFNFAKRDIVFGLGTAPLFECMMRKFKKDNITVVIPSGSYAEFVSAAQVNKVDVQIVECLEEDGFKLTPDMIKKILEEYTQKRGNKEEGGGGGGIVFYLNCPFINPTGQVYHTAEITIIRNILADHNQTHKDFKSLIILDTIFSFLNIDDNCGNIDLEVMNDDNVYLMEGISKAFAAGGLRFGFISTSDKSMCQYVQRFVDKPSKNMNLMMVKFYQNIMNVKSGVWNHILKQQRKLQKRCQEFIAILKKGFTILPPKGGLFLCVKPNKNLIGKSINGLKITENNLADILFKSMNVRINGPNWTKLPGYYRIVISITDKDFEKLKNRFKKFLFETLF